MLFVVMATARRAKGAADVIMAVLTADDGAIDPAKDVQVGLLIHFHHRLGHILYDTWTPASSSPTVVASHA